MIGWYDYLYGDNAKANAAIKKDNPDISDDQIAYSIAKMKQYGIVDSGDTKTLGIGAMTEERQKNFFDKMVKAGVIAGDLDYKKTYTLQFVEQKGRPRPRTQELSPRGNVMATAVTVLYPNVEDATFDLDYYLSKHMPLVADRFAPHGIKGGRLESSMYSVIATMEFDREDQFRAAITAEGAVKRGDGPNGQRQGTRDHDRRHRRAER